MQPPADGIRPEAAPARPRRDLLLRYAVAVLGCTVLLGALLASVRSSGSPVVRLDREWVGSLHGYARRHAAWTASMQTVTDLGGPLTMRVLLGLAAAWLWAIGARALAVRAGALLLVGWAAGWAGKALADRARPHFAAPVSHAAGSAFPSGHALASAITCAALVALVRRKADRAGRVAAFAAAVPVVLTVGWTRIALGVHWPSDVVAGWLTAGLVFGAVTFGVELWHPGALARDVRLVNRRTGPRVQSVLTSRGDDPDAQ